MYSAEYSDIPAVYSWYILEYSEKSQKCERRARPTCYIFSQVFRFILKIHLKIHSKYTISVRKRVEFDTGASLTRADAGPGFSPLKPLLRNEQAATIAFSVSSGCLASMRLLASFWCCEQRADQTNMGTLVLAENR